MADDVEFINEHPEDSEFLDNRPKREPGRGLITLFLIHRKWAADDTGAFKIILSTSIILLVLAALIFGYYQHGVDQFKQVPQTVAVT